MSDEPDVPDSDEPKVFSVRKIGGQWSLDRREFVKGAGAGAGVALGTTLGTSQVEAATGNVIFAHSDIVLDLTVSDNRLVSCGRDKKLKLWVLPESSVTNTAKTSKGHTDAVTAVLWDPYDRFVVSGGADKKIIFWKTDLSATLSSVKAPAPVKSVSISTDGKFLVAALGSKISQYSITGFDPVSVEHVHDIDVGVNVNSVVFTAHENQFWCTCADGKIRVYSAAATKPIKVLRKHRGQVRASAFNANLNLVATSGSDRIVQIWDPENFEELSEFSAHESDIRDLAFNTTGDRLACASWDDSATVWNTNGPKRLHHLKGHTSDVNAVAFSSDSQFLYTGSDDKSVIQWDLETGEIVKRLIDLDASPKDAEGVKYKVTNGVTTTTYTLPCGSPIPAGAVCTCNCVPGSWSAPSSKPTTRTYSYHYWYPN